MIFKKVENWVSCRPPLVPFWHLPSEVLKFLRGKDLHANIFRVQPDKSFLCGYYCLKFLDFMFDGKSLMDFTSIFSPTDFVANDRKILKLFDMWYAMRVLLVLLVLSWVVTFGNSLECHIFGNEKCMPRDSLVETNLWKSKSAWALVIR